MPVNAAEFYRRLDEYYGAGKRPEAYAFMKEQKAEAERRGDDSMSLTIANALLGYCREFCLFDEMDGLYAEAVRCIEALGLQGTMEEAITLLNAATGFCVMGREAQSEELYRKTIALHEALLPPGDPRLAAVYNNHGLLYRAQNKREQALQDFRRALEILLAGNGAPDEVASSHLNIASVCGDLAEAEQHAALALEYYATEAGQADIHRFTAMATRAELLFRRGKFAEAGRAFEDTAVAWRRFGGAKQRLAVLLRNALYSYEKAEDAAAAERIRTRLREETA